MPVRLIRAPARNVETAHVGSAHPNPGAEHGSQSKVSTEPGGVRIGAGGECGLKPPSEDALDEENRAEDWPQAVHLIREMMLDRYTRGQTDAGLTVFQCGE